MNDYINQCLKEFDTKFEHIAHIGVVCDHITLLNLKKFIKEKLEEQAKKMDKPIERDNEFWEDIIYRDGKLDKEQIMKELSDYSYLLKEVSKVYCHITGGLLSKQFYSAETIISVSDDLTNKIYDENLPEIEVESEKMEHLEKGAQLKKDE